MKLYKAKEALKENVLKLEIKIDACNTFKDLNKLLDDCLGYYKEISEEQHKKNRKKTEEHREKYGKEGSGIREFMRCFE